MSNKLLLTIFLLLWTITGMAALPIEEADSTRENYVFDFTVDDENRAIIDAMDSMFLELIRSDKYLVDKNLNNKQVKFEAGAIPIYSDSVYAFRLRVIPTPIELSYNNKVRRYIEVYSVHKREHAQKILSLTSLYFPIFEAELDKMGMPMELKYLPIIESALNTHAVSRQGATGLWQIMYATGKMLGLRIDSYVDERRDPYAATIAAVKYLRDLHNIYGDWLMAIAAYNCGPGNLNKAIRRSGGKRDIWTIYEYLPRETRGYIPAFIGATYVFEYYKDHNMAPFEHFVEHEWLDTIMVDKQISFAQLSSYLNMTEDELSYYNPALKKKIVPGMREPYPLRLPFSRIAYFIDNMELILETADSADKPSITTPTTLKEPSELKSSSSYNSQNTYTQGTQLYYTVKSGDNLGYIADWYDVGVSKIRQWNGIYGNTIRPGQKIKIYKPDHEADRYGNIDKLSFREKQNLSGYSTNTPPKKTFDTNSDSYIYYTIKQGDTLWAISNRYPNNSIENIMRLNNITSHTRLQPGDVLKLNP